MVPEVALCWVGSQEGCLGLASAGGQLRDGPTQLCAVHVCVHTPTHVYM